jgi:hypothetical protein
MVRLDQHKIYFQCYFSRLHARPEDGRLKIVGAELNLVANSLQVLVVTQALDATIVELMLRVVY